MVGKKPCLTLALAKKMADAAQKKAEELHLKICVSIIDDGGNLFYFFRMDHTSYGSIRISELKARTSASLPLSSKALGERNAGMPGGPYGGGAIPGLLLLAGGLPILTATKAHLGGIGVSGATPDLDETCAHAGLEAIREELDRF